MPPQTKSARNGFPSGYVFSNFSRGSFRFMAGLATMAACSSDDSSSGTGGAAGSSSGGGGTGGGSGGSAGSATGGSAGTASGGSAGTASGGAAGGTGTDCDTCLETNCKTEMDACMADTDCTKLLQCAGACADSACIQQCMTDNPNGATKFAPVATCAQTKCATEC